MKKLQNKHQALLFSYLGTSLPALLCAGTHTPLPIHLQTTWQCSTTSMHRADPGIKAERRAAQPPAPENKLMLFHSLFLELTHSALQHMDRAEKYRPSISCEPHFLSFQSTQASLTHWWHSAFNSAYRREVSHENMQYAATFISTSSLTRKTENSVSTLTTSQLKTQATLKYTAFQIHVLFMCIFLFQKHSCRDSTFPSHSKNTNSTTSVSKLLKKKKHAWMRYDEQGLAFQISGSLAKKLCVLTYTHSFCKPVRRPQCLSDTAESVVPLRTDWGPTFQQSKAINLQEYKCNKQNRSEIVADTT